MNEINVTVPSLLLVLVVFIAVAVPGILIINAIFKRMEHKVHAEMQRKIEAIEQERDALYEGETPEPEEFDWDQELLNAQRDVEEEK